MQFLTVLTLLQLSSSTNNTIQNQISSLFDRLFEEDREKLKVFGQVYLKSFCVDLQSQEVQSVIRNLQTVNKTLSLKDLRQGTILRNENKNSELWKGYQIEKIFNQINAQQADLKKKIGTMRFKITLKDPAEIIVLEEIKTKLIELTRLTKEPDIINFLKQIKIFLSNLIRKYEEENITLKKHKQIIETISEIDFKLNEISEELNLKNPQAYIEKTVSKIRIETINILDYYLKFLFSMIPEFQDQNFRNYPIAKLFKKTNILILENNNNKYCHLMSQILNWEQFSFFYPIIQKEKINLHFNNQRQVKPGATRLLHDSMCRIFYIAYVCLQICKNKVDYILYIKYVQSHFFNIISEVVNSQSQIIFKCLIELCNKKKCKIPKLEEKNNQLGFFKKLFTNEKKDREEKILFLKNKLFSLRKFHLSIIAPFKYLEQSIEELSIFINRFYNPYLNDHKINNNLLELGRKYFHKLLFSPINILNTPYKSILPPTDENGNKITTTNVPLVTYSIDANDNTDDNFESFLMESPKIKKLRQNERKRLFERTCEKGGKKRKRRRKKKRKEREREKEKEK
ncbi:hypothetical protein M0813_25361 [Anaeramoeba flamelloides]|uniref:Uncharacterized protein n=1 Tax=Anaeramoeba flamelloides TaxID=1746091 RepID=A0ABQ8Y4C7_9EUKA|nr:hypothetical protein M0813_25361 [Anaeramoeba flamelloides]